MKSLENIREKYGNEPLIQLIRRLIITLDQTADGSDEQVQTIEILRTLSNEPNLPAETPIWLDWLEGMNEELLTWENLESSFGQRSPQGRRIVDIEDDIPITKKKGSNIPLTKEQAIWDKALRRSENKGRHKWYKFIGICIIAISLLIIYLYWQNNQNNSKKIKNSTFVEYHKPSPKYLSQKAAPLWLDFSTKNIKPSDLYLIPYAPLLDKYKKNWFDSMSKNDFLKQIENTSSKTLWLWLWQREQDLLNNSIPRVQFNLNGIKSGEKLWQWRRFNDLKPGQPTTGEFKEKILWRQDRWDISISKSYQEGPYHQSFAHRFTINKYGDLAWSWRLRLNQKNYSGSLVNQPRKKSTKITNKGFDWPNESQIFNQNQAAFPAIFSPSLMQLSLGSKIFALSGQLISNQDFLHSLSIEGELNSDFFIINEKEAWSESWTPINP